MVQLDDDGLAKQDKDNVILKDLAADTPEVISRQVDALENFRICCPKFFTPQIFAFLHKK